MIIQCIIGMVPFLTLVTLFVLTFSMVHLSLEREEKGDAANGFGPIAIN